MLYLIVTREKNGKWPEVKDDHAITEALERAIEQHGKKNVRLFQEIYFSNEVVIPEVQKSLKEAARPHIGSGKRV